ncbi:hypothetical protein P3T27_002357 [Kitasatospora sp. MAA19]|nr:hypothetical protein [Kitasatospora sp. MAA19]
MSAVSSLRVPIPVPSTVRRAVPVLQLFREIKESGYTGSPNPLYRSITQGRAEGDKPVTTPQRFARLLLSRPGNLRDKDTALLRELTDACPERTELSHLTREFARLPTPAEGNDATLADWITTVRATDLPHLHSVTNGLELDRAAVDAGLTLPWHNGRTEGGNTRTKRTMRQIHGRAGSPCSATASSSSDHHTALPPTTGQRRRPYRAEDRTDPRPAPPSGQGPDLRARIGYRFAVRCPRPACRCTGSGCGT